MNTKPLLTAAALALGLFPLGLAARADNAMGGLSVTASVTPNPPRAGNNALDLTVTDAAGKRVTGLKLTATVAMASMDMGTATPAFTDAGNGHYRATVVFGMAGPRRVVVKGPGGKLAALDFQAGGKTLWKSPTSKMPTPKTPVPAAPVAAAMHGMDMSGAMPGKPADAAPARPSSSGGMSGMNMNGMGMKGMTGIADMKTATIPRLQETGTYTATGDENWKQQTGFGRNAPMVAMMNRMMVGGSGGEGMKMAPMKMDFGPTNYAKPAAGDAGTGNMAGMDMGQDSAKGMEMSAPSEALKITATMPSAAKAGDNPFDVTVMDAAGKPVTGAKITATVAMTSMDMGTTHPAVAEAGNGKYAATVNFGMVGPWRVTLTVTASGQQPQTKAFDFSAK